MRYQAIAPSVEATCFTLGDRQLVAVARGESIAAIPASAFLFLFQPAEATMGAPEPVRQKAKRGKSEYCTIDVTRHHDSPLTNDILAVVGAEALVTSEVIDHVCAGTHWTRKAVSARMHQLEKLGRLERREQPETRLDKWYLVEAKCPR